MQSSYAYNVIDKRQALNKCKIPHISDFAEQLEQVTVEWGGEGFLTSFTLQTLQSRDSCAYFIGFAWRTSRPHRLQIKELISDKISVCDQNTELRTAWTLPCVCGEGGETTGTVQAKLVDVTV